MDHIKREIQPFPVHHEGSVLGLPCPSLCETVRLSVVHQVKMPLLDESLGVRRGQPGPAADCQAQGHNLGRRYADMAGRAAHQQPASRIAHQLYARPQLIQLDAVRTQDAVRTSDQLRKIGLFEGRVQRV
jgi:hypothetical protein